MRIFLQNLSKYSKYIPKEIESNARIVEWEDGGFSIYVGKEFLADLTEREMQAYFCVDVNPQQSDASKNAIKVGFGFFYIKN